MLYFLLFFPSLHLATGKLWTVTGNDIINVDFCPVKFYSLTYTQIYISFFHSGVSLCLNRYYAEPQSSMSPADDCIFLPAVDVYNVSIESEAHSFVKALDKASLPTGALKCGFRLDFRYKASKNGSIYYAMFKSDSWPRPVLYAKGEFKSWGRFAYMYTLVNNTLGDRTNITWIDGAPPSTALIELRGCRYMGKVYKFNTMTKNPLDCSSLTCNPDLSVTTRGYCDPSTKCDGKGGCLKTESCSVIGPNVIDSSHRVTSIPDRCVYTLITSGNLEVLAEFLERRRTDLSFLDGLYLKLDRSKFHLQQGAQVHMNGRRLNLNSSAKTFGNLKLFKDSFGIQAKVQSANKTVLIFFDGSSAHISIQSYSENKGLCIDSRGPIKNHRRIDVSAASCQRSFTEDPDPSVNCTVAKGWCESLQTSVRDPKGSKKPEPFIEACSKTMCVYPDTDGLFCHFLQLYGRSAGLSIKNHSCASPSPCVHHYCSPHEFCGLSDDGEATCYCRGVFAAPYRKTRTYGEGTTCGVDSASVELPMCLVEEKGFNPSQLHLLDASCEGQINDTTHTVTFSFTHSETCGALISSNQSHILYRNTIMAHYPASDTIVRSNLVYLDFTCAYDQPRPNVMSFKIQDSSVMQTFTAGVFSYTVRQRVCSDPTCVQELNRGDLLKLGQTLWIQMDSDDLDTNLVVLVLDSCWIGDRSQGGRRHALIINGCANPNDLTVKVVENGYGDRCSFSFKVFQFIDYSGEVRLHCTLAVCLKGNDCVPKCPGAAGVSRFSRQQRSLTRFWTEPFTSLSWDQVGPEA